MDTTPLKGVCSCPLLLQQPLSHLAAPQGSLVSSSSPTFYHCRWMSYFFFQLQCFCSSRPGNSACSLLLGSITPLICSQERMNKASIIYVILPDLEALFHFDVDACKSLHFPDIVLYLYNKIIVCVLANSHISQGHCESQTKHYSHLINFKQV